VPFWHPGQLSQPRPEPVRRTRAPVTVITYSEAAAPTASAKSLPGAATRARSVSTAIRPRLEKRLEKLGIAVGAGEGGGP
jgi:hypothetical protein